MKFIDTKMLKKLAVPTKEYIPLPVPLEPMTIKSFMNPEGIAFVGSDPYSRCF